MDNSPYSDKERELITALQALGAGWHSRSKLAAQLGKRRLNPVETTVLDFLVTAGKLDRRLTTGPRANVQQWEYQVKG